MTKITWDAPELHWGDSPGAAAAPGEPDHTGAHAAGPVPGNWHLRGVYNSCTVTVRLLYTDCTLDVHWLYTGCKLDVHSLYTWCTLTVQCTIWIIKISRSLPSKCLCTKYAEVWLQPKQLRLCWLVCRGEVQPVCGVLLQHRGPHWGARLHSSREGGRHTLTSYDLHWILNENNNKAKMSHGCQRLVFSVLDWY